MTLLIGKGLRNKKAGGFTLIELIIVVGIVLVSLTLSMPAFRGVYQNSLIKNATRELAHSLAYARDLAILEGISYEVNFDVYESRYSISSVPDSMVIKQMTSVVKRSFVYNYLPENVDFARLSNQKITFYPNGSSEDFFIYLQDNKNNIYAVTIKGVYSQIKTFDYDYD